MKFYLDASAEGWDSSYHLELRAKGMTLIVHR
jgi:hypothetical protein